MTDERIDSTKRGSLQKSNIRSDLIDIFLNNDRTTPPTGDNDFINMCIQ